MKTAWKKFKELLPVLSSSHLSFKTCGCVYSSCVLSAMLYVSETWPLTKPNLQSLQRNDQAMIRQICIVRPQDVVTTRSNEQLARLGIEDLDLILKERRHCWYGHAEHSNCAIKTTFDIQVDGKCGPRRPKMTWKQLTERDCRECTCMLIKKSADDDNAPASPIWRGGPPLLPSPATPLPSLICPLSYFNSRHKTLHFDENFVKIGHIYIKKSYQCLKVSFMCTLFLRYFLWNGIIFCKMCSY